nr:BatA domain-containing protein [Verrucomicrobiota bacterium]
MTFLLPAFLGAAALASVPVILHFLRRKPQQLIPFPTLRFLGATAIRETQRHRIRRWITLALRCLVIALLAAAFARPFFAAQRGD